MTFLEDWPVQMGMDSNRMLEYVGPFAQDMIRRNDTLWPCGVGVTTKGELEPFMAGDDFESANDAFECMITSLIAEKDYWRAACCAAAVTLSDDSEALSFTLEHATGECFIAIMPYSRTRLLKQIIFDELSLYLTQPIIWAGSDGLLSPNDPTS